MSFCQSMQHGIIRCMRNDIHKHLQVLKKQKHMKQPFRNNLPGTSTGLTDKKKHEVTFQKQFAWHFHMTYKQKHMK